GAIMQPVIEIKEEEIQPLLPTPLKKIDEEEEASSTYMHQSHNLCENMASPVGCEHYVRSCLLKAPCCGKLYVCRLCHDAEENHEMDRFKVREVQCSECETVQEAQQTCQQCNVNFGEYYCDICHLFDKNKKQYHCQPCGI
ncbi:RING finger and CHY zinc finger domain-containing protein 1, partial [Notothenia coriiceps]|uniref:RING finger and CHY zinc finger domain-containing protein 1 n=1 Tax=Notothenia coriiceps TaxID=8208 RepID=A0A6I9PRE4_9TELE